MIFQLISPNLSLLFEKVLFKNIYSNLSLLFEKMFKKYLFKSFSSLWKNVQKYLCKSFSSLWKNVQKIAIQIFHFSLKKCSKNTFKSFSSLWKSVQKYLFKFSLRTKFSIAEERNYFSKLKDNWRNDRRRSVKFIFILSPRSDGLNEMVPGTSTLYRIKRASIYARIKGI